MKKKLLIRIGALVVLLAVAGCMFIIGRGHTVYFDNKTLEIGENSYPAMQKVVVKVQGEKDSKLAKRERGMAKCTGQNFRMTLEVTVNKGDEPVTHEIKLKLPYSWDGIVVNIPGLLAGLDESQYLSQFVSTVEEAPEEEEVTTDEFGLGDI